MIGVGGGMLIMGLTLGGTLGLIAKRDAKDEMPEDPDFTDRM
jgi:hypothetical protein